MSIIFKEDTHQYFNTENGREYLSGTKFLHLFEPEFDSYNISLRVASKEGRTQQEVLDEWKETSRIACETGTKIHAIMENFIKFNDVNEEYIFEILDRWAEDVLAKILIMLKQYIQKDCCGLTNLKSQVLLTF